MKPDNLKKLSPSEQRVVEALITTNGGNVTTIAQSLYVTYQCVANHLSVIYDKLHDDLGGNRTLQALAIWHLRGVAVKGIGVAILLLIFNTYTFMSDDHELMTRRARRGRRNEYELIED